eukprot:NODE_954_length_2799_cov_0.717037.p3 type:complete len:112 gc:universal NODE_954_length_2799_cov_0.717037:2644-2309(-)
MTQNTTTSIRSWIFTIPKRITYSLTSATTTTGTKFIHQIYIITCLSKYCTKTFNFYWFFEFTMLTLFEITCRYNSLFRTTEYFLKRFIRRASVICRRIYPPSLSFLNIYLL